MGLVEVLPRVPNLLRRLRQTAALALAERPDALVMIDAPGFNFRLARRLTGRGIPLIHMVAPTVWAWRPGRARRIAGFLDHLLVLLPFEPPYFEREGLATTFVGHPVLDSGADRGQGAAFRARHRIAAETPVLAVLPGSRAGEVSRLLPVFGETLALLRQRIAGLHAVVPTLEPVAGMVQTAAAQWAVPVTVLGDAREKYDAMAASQAALAASGTVALELALADVPAVVAYRVHPLTAFLVRRLVRVSEIDGVRTGFRVAEDLSLADDAWYAVISLDNGIPVGYVTRTGPPSKPSAASTSPAASSTTTADTKTAACDSRTSTLSRPQSSSGS